MVCILHGCYDAHSRMRFSLSPPPPKATLSTGSAATAGTETALPTTSIATSPTYRYGGNNNNYYSSSMQRTAFLSSPAQSDDETVAAAAATAATTTEEDAAIAASDYNQWLHAMKLVARLPGGMPPEFRRKLWLSLADKYLKSKNLDWSKEEEKCFCEKWREDDEELGIQIVKDLHRTGSNLCTGPAGNINQAKLKRILLGYARYNPEVGYCQGFNMLGALILQVMDKEEAESIKVMIYLVEGVLPTGYFCGSMGGLQADMSVFRELMQTKLPRLAKHLQKLQGPVENAYEPPLTNVFTMQWFLTMFCTCLPMTCVLRVWDLVLIEGSDVLLRTALVLWGLLEERVLNARTADDFYGKMGSFSSELLNGHLIDSNGLIEKVVQLGPIPDIQKLRDKHLYNIAPLRHKQGLQLYFDDEEPESDEDSRLAVATVWGIPWGRRGSHSQSTASTVRQPVDNKDRLALDISLLKKQYDRLRERQKQAHIILTTACSTARQGTATAQSNSTVPVNQLLLGRTAILTNKGRRVGPPPGAIPPARKPSLPTILQTKPQAEKQLRRGETLHWRDTDLSKRRRDSLSWKEIKADRATLLRDGSATSSQSSKLRARIGKSDSSSYSEESDENDDDDGDGSSTDTSLCDEDDPVSTGDKTHSSSIENSPKRKQKTSRKQKELTTKLAGLSAGLRETRVGERPKSWAPSSTEIPFLLMTSDSPVHSGDEKSVTDKPHDYFSKEEEDSAMECDRVGYKRVKELEWSDTTYSPIAGDLATKLTPLHVLTDIVELPGITSTSQLSPMPDISTYLNNSTISPLPTPKPLFVDSTNSLGSGDGDERKNFDVSDDGVINEYFERVNSVERPTKLDLFYSLNEEDSIRTAYKEGTEGNLQKATAPAIEPATSIAEVESVQLKDVTGYNELNRHKELLEGYSEISSNAFIAAATSELSTNFKKNSANCLETENIEFDPTQHIRDDNIPGENRDDFKEGYPNNCEEPKPEAEPKPAALCTKPAVYNISKKRRDPRRLTRSSTIDIEERYQALEKRLSTEEPLKTMDCSKADSSYARVEPDSHMKVVRRIPSTADLEVRYNSLDKQLSIGKELPNRQPLMEPDDESVRSNDKSYIDSENDPPATTEHKRIPSVEDLENRFDALARHMSSSSGSAKGNPIEMKDNGSEENIDQPDENCPKDHSEEKLKSATSKSEIESESTTKSNSTDKDGTKPRLKKLPSTAELEDRFNALEREMSIQKSTPSKSKKEPPDENTSDKKNKDIDAGASLDDLVDKPGESEENSKHCEKSAVDHSPKEPTTETATPKKLSPKPESQANILQETCESDARKAESQKSTKKTPPSTEELEKRFQALEKQLSTASLDGVQKSKDSATESTVKNARKETDDKSQLPTSCDEKDKDPIQLFEEKCKDVNEQLSESTFQKEEALESREFSNNQKKAQEMFEVKITSINEELEKEKEEGDKLSENLGSSRPTEGSKQRTVVTSKRRASEPPSTEDLEKRYDTLKRRMSTKTFRENNLTRPETVEEALQRIEQGVIDEKSDIPEPKHEAALTTTAKDTPPKNTKKTSEPPTTENLEKRFEALQRQSSTMSEKLPKKEEDKERVKETSEEISKQSTEEIPKKVVPDTKLSKEMPSPQMEHTKVAGDKSSEIPKNIIPHAPPMPAVNRNMKILIPDKSSQRRALVEELQSKIKTQPNDENLKPSEINPKRKTANVTSRADATSEAHAATAFFRSGNYEPWHPAYPPHRMVRRFSDLPSRSDLENRLQFLEKQLFKKFQKQRCASDSEVTSRKFFTEGKRTGNNDDAPCTSTKAEYEGDLEKRVQALEKQLSENSLKLLEAMRKQTQHGNCEEARSPRKSDAENESPRTLSTETMDATGKELVRYSHCGEVEETESHKPINISINIKMLLNKDGEERKKRTENLPTTEELEKRLEMLEQQLNGTKPSTSLPTEREETKENLAADESDIQDEVFIEQSPKEDDARGEKVVQLDPAHEHAELPEENGDIGRNMAAEKSPVDSDVREITKEEKTLENQEIARNNAKVQQQDINKNIENNEKDHEKELTVSRTTEADSTITTHVDEDHEKADRSPELPTTTTNKEDENPKETSKELPDNLVINAGGVGPVDPNNKTLVLLLDNEPKAVKVRRLTRANTEELEDLFQALEKQLSDRNLIKSEDGKLMRADTKEANKLEEPTEESRALSNLTKEIEEFTSGEKDAKQESKTEKEEHDWGPDPVKRHLKRKTVHLPSTKELEARFRSLERQIQLLEHVENIDVEQRLNEIERKIKLQYSLSHEKDLSKFLELCEGKGLDDPIESTPAAVIQKCECGKTTQNSPGHAKPKSPYTSPSRTKDKFPYTSPTRSKSPARTKSPVSRSPYTSPSRTSNQSPGQLQKSQSHEDEGIPSTEDLEYRFRALDLTRSKSKENLKEKPRMKLDPKKQPIHPLEILLDPSPDDSFIPTTGELEHRLKVLDEKRKTPSPPRQRRNRSPTIEDIKQQKLIEEQRPKTPIHCLETLVASPTKRELPTTDELDARMRALEKDQCFDVKMQKNFKDFSQKLKDVISPSLSFEEYKASKSREESPIRNEIERSTTPKSSLHDSSSSSRRDGARYRSTSPKVIRFSDEEEYRPKSRSEPRETGRMTLADSNSSIYGSSAALAEGLDEMGSRLMRETSPLQRTGTHTGIPLRTNDNINERLSSIKETIKSIDTLCEEKPYRKEKCQRYIDSLFSDSVHFTNKKSSHEDLYSRCSRSPSRTQRDYTPSIRVSDHSQRPSEYYLSRSIGSAESIRSISPLRAVSPLHHRSNRDIRREVSPRRRRDEELEEYESRVRRENILPNYFPNNYSDLSSDSLIKFHKVDRQQLDTYKYDEREKSSSRSASRSPLMSTYGSRETMMMMLHNNANTTENTPHTTTTVTAQHSNRLELDRPVSPYRQTSHTLLGYDSPLKRATTPVYNPAKLEIRHTTVTSTFYDRLLTEKHIEKTLSHTPSRSPVISPSVISKSYLDIPIASAGNTDKSQESSPTSATEQLRSFMGATASLGIASASTAIPDYTGTSTYRTITDTITATTAAPYTQYSANMPTAGGRPTTTSFHSTLTPSSNLVQCTVASSASGSQTATTNSSSCQYNPSITSFNSALPVNAVIITTPSTSYSFANPIPATVGVCNPIMPLAMQQPTEIGTTFGLYTANTLNNNTGTSSVTISSSNTTEMPKL